MGTTAQVIEGTKEIIRNVSPGGGHIFGSSNSIHDGVTLENLNAMIETAYSHGTYPIRGSEGYEA